jgi:DeoR/GlpR family transcriptional regulator of sugar metabolism
MISSRTRDLAPARFEHILDMLRRSRFARVNDLCAQLPASAATVRRDLVELERRGSVRRLHGGAMLDEAHLDEPAFEDKESVSATEKQRIAEAAMRFVGPNDTLFLDGGSTVLALARLLTGATGATVVTNSLRVAGVLANSGPRLILIGGELRRRSQTFVGPLTRHLLEPLNVDKAFMGTIGLELGRGLTTTDPLEAYTKQLVMQKARQVVLLADHTKVGRVSFERFGGCDDVDVLVTDPSADRKALRGLRKSGLHVVVA